MDVSDLKQDMEVIAHRLREDLLSDRVSVDRIRRDLERLDATGRWPDVDYENRARTHWEPSRHTRRLASMAQAYRKAKSPLEGDDRLKQAILSGLHFFVERDPQSDNWWFNVIDTPRYIGRVLLLMGDVVAQVDLARAEQMIRRSGFTRTGANLIWEAGNLMVLACVIGDVGLLREAIAHITAEIRITTEEGIQPDFSFHQHGPQLYMSNYGEVFSTSNSLYANLFAETSFALSSEKIAALSGLIREGQQWFMWGRQFDYHALGRQLDSPGAKNRGRALAGVSKRMQVVDPDHVDEYADFAERILGKQEPGSTGPRGNRHYWRSDVMVHRPGGFYASVRMHSTRTYATEVRTNRENLKGYHLSDGAYFLMQRGDEYHDIQPIWDWRKLPGVTFRDTEEPFPYGREAKQSGNTEFVGGVSDGRVGVAAMDYDKGDVKARKAWFFLDDGFVCLGTGISTERDEMVTTSVNQCLLKSEVFLLQDGEVIVPGDGRIDRKNLQGVFHDGVGYYFLDPYRVVLNAGSQSGKWTDIEEASSRKQMVKKDVFSLWIDHGRRPQDVGYAYRVVPGVSESTFADAALPIRVLVNTADLQAVSLPGLVQAVFYAPGKLEDGTRVDAPCLLMLRRVDGGIELSVSDPTQKLAQIRVWLPGRYEGIGCTYQEEDQTTGVTVDLPEDAFAGQTVQIMLSEN